MHQAALLVDPRLTLLLSACCAVAGGLLSVAELGLAHWRCRHTRTHADKGGAVTMASQPKTRHTHTATACILNFFRWYFDQYSASLAPSRAHWCVRLLGARADALHA